MEYILKKTIELTNEEKEQICNLFFDVFEKDKKVIDFDKQFLSSYKGYSYHCFIKNENNIIVGIKSVIPYKYNFFNKIIEMGLLVDVMIKKEFRALKHFAYMSLKLNEISKKENLSFLYAYPNDNSYPIFKKMLEYKDIGRQNFYVLPINIANLKKMPVILNSISNFTSSILCSDIVLRYSKNKIYPRDIEKCNNNEFINQRYNKEHKIIKMDGFTFIYKVEEFEGDKVSYILDIYPLSKHNIERSVQKIYKIHKSDIDIIMYIGNLKFNPINLIKIPLKYEPKNINFIGLILDNNIVDDRIYNLDFWESNLSNFDVI